MILPHPMLNLHIERDYIDQVAEREGYELFIPYTLVEHLIYAFSFYRVLRSPYECIQEKNSYTKEFHKLLGMIRFEDVKTDNPVVFAIRVLKIVSKKINLRRLDNAAQTGEFPEFWRDTDKDEKPNNYKFDLHDLSYQQLVTLRLMGTDPDTVELSEEVQKLLLLHDGMQLFKQPTDPEYNVIKKTITSYSDFHRTRRYRMSLPTFGADLGMKKLQITKVEEQDNYASEVILAIDYSLSMNDTKLSKTMIRSVLLYYIGQMEKYPNIKMSIVNVIGAVDSVQKIESIEELKSAFNNLPSFVLPVKPSTNIFKDLGSMYAGRSVVFLTDGRLVLPVPLKLNYKLYSIVLTPNEMLKQTCLISGGQFIILK